MHRRSRSNPDRHKRLSALSASVESVAKEEAHTRSASLPSSVGLITTVQKLRNTFRLRSPSKRQTKAEEEGDKVKTAKAIPEPPKPQPRSTIEKVTNHNTDPPSPIRSKTGKHTNKKKHAESRSAQQPSNPVASPRTKRLTKVELQRTTLNKREEIDFPQRYEKENKRRQAKPQSHEELKVKTGERKPSAVKVTERQKSLPSTGDVPEVQSEDKAVPQPAVRSVNSPQATRTNLTIGDADKQEQWVSINDLEKRLDALALENKNTRKQMQLLRKVNKELEDMLLKTTMENKQLVINAHNLKQKESNKQHGISRGVQASIFTCQHCHQPPIQRNSNTYLQLTDGFIPSMCDDSISLEVETQRIIDRIQNLTSAMDRHCLANKKLRFKVEQVLHTHTIKDKEKNVRKSETDDPV